MKFNKIQTSINDSDFKSLLRIVGSDEQPIVVTKIKFSIENASILPDFIADNNLVSYYGVVWVDGKEVNHRHFLFTEHVAKYTMSVYEITDFDEGGPKLISDNSKQINMFIENEVIRLNHNDHYLEWLYDSIVPSGLFELCHNDDGYRVAYIEPNESDKYNGLSDLLIHYLQCNVEHDGSLPLKNHFRQQFSYLIPNAE